MVKVKWIWIYDRWNSQKAKWKLTDGQKWFIIITWRASISIWKDRWCVNLLFKDVFKCWNFAIDWGLQKGRFTKVSSISTFDQIFTQLNLYPLFNYRRFRLETCIKQASELMIDRSLWVVHHNIKCGVDFEAFFQPKQVVRPWIWFTAWFSQGKLRPWISPSLFQSSLSSSLLSSPSSRLLFCINWLGDC